MGSEAHLIELIFFLIANAIFAVIGIVATYRFLWKKIVGQKKEAPEPHQASERELALEAQMREMRKMIEMLASAQQEQGVEPAFNRSDENTDKVSGNVK